MQTTCVRSVAVAAAVLVACPAQAGLIPALNVQWTLNGDTVYDELPAGSPNGQGGYRYNGFADIGGVTMDYSVIGDPDPRISSGFTVENLSGATVEIELLVTLPIDPAVSAPSDLTGSVAVGMTADAGGGTLAALPGVPFWQALIDGTPVGGVTDLLAGLSIMQIGSGSPDGQSAGFVHVPGPEALDSIGILVSFSLTAGEQMSFTSVFNVVPAPGGLALLGLATLGAGRRRRKA